MNPTTINTEKLDLSVLIEYINECHDGNILYLIAHIDNAIYMQHFVNAETFNERDIRDTVTALKGIKDCLLEAHLKQQGWFYKKMG